MVIAMVIAMATPMAWLALVASRTIKKLTATTAALVHVLILMAVVTITATAMATATVTVVDIVPLKTRGTMGTGTMLKGIARITNTPHGMIMPTATATAMGQLLRLSPQFV